MSDPMVLVDEVEPRAPPQVYVQADGRMQNRHDAGPNANVAAQVEAYWIGAAKQHVPWTEQNRGCCERQRGICSGDAEMRDEIATSRKESPKERCAGQGYEGNREMPNDSALPVREVALRPSNCRLWRCNQRRHSIESETRIEDVA